MVTKTCERCGNPFDVFPCRATARFCNQDCATPPVFRDCAHCGSEFRVSATRSKYCSHDCYKAFLKKAGVQRPCANCSTIMDVPLWDAENRKYCSKPCWRAAQRVIPEKKLCKRCKIEKPLTEFYKDKSAKTVLKLQGVCRECSKQVRREYYYANLEKSRAKMREQHQRKKGIYYAKAKEWRAKNPEKVKAMKKAWDAKAVLLNPNYHKQCYQKKNGREVARLWRLKPENARKAADVQSRRRAQKQATEVEMIFREVVIERDGCICYLCGLNLRSTPKLIHIEHVVPLVKGGSHTYSNVAVSCADCNLRKNARLPSECPWAKNRLALVLHSDSCNYLIFRQQ